MSGLTRQIVTLQVGHYANFVGTHWWNIQNASFVYNPSLKPAEPKELNSDVLFREGQNLMGDVTYTPRLIAFDLKGSLNTLKQSGTLYDIEDHDEDLLWSHDVTMHKSDASQKNEFLQDLDKNDIGAVGQNTAEVSMTVNDAEQDVASVDELSELPTVSAAGKVYNLDDSVRVWSDFLHPHIHPRSVHIIDTYQHNSDVERFDVCGLGAQLYASHRENSAIEDRLHFFTEECDSLQGFHMLVDAYDGFGGLSTALLQDVVDDFTSKGILTFTPTPAVFPDYTVQEMQYNIVNTAITYDSLLRHSSLVVPLSMSTKLWQVSDTAPVCQLPYLNYRADLHYHTSAVLSAAVDSLSVPYRKINSPSSLTDLTNALSPLGRKVACIEAAFPFPLPETGCIVDALLNTRLSQMSHSLTPSCHPAVTPDAQSVVISGIPRDRVFGAVNDESQTFYADCGSTLEEALALHLQQTCSSSLNAVCAVTQPCRVAAPFPHIFTANVSSSGFVSANLRSSNKGVDSVPVMTSLQSSRAAGRHVRDLLTLARKLDVRRLHKVIDAGLEADEFGEVLESLETVASCYDTETVDML